MLAKLKLMKMNQSQYLSKNKNLSELIEQSSTAYQDSIAIYYQELTISYKVLNGRANQLAHFIRQCGLNSGCNVVIFLDRSVDTIVSLLAVMRSDNTYIPVDKDITIRQFKQITEDCEPTLLLINTPLPEKIKKVLSSQIKIINLDEQKEEINCMPVSSLGLTLTNQVAYILYTSGTTGIPKGVQITHSSLINFLCSMRENINFSKEDLILAITPTTFDISATEIYLPLITGASLVFVDNATRFDPIKLQYYLSKYKVTFMQATPITWLMLIDNGWKNETRVKIICGGEAFSVYLAKKLKAISDSVWNFYGPTETTVWSTYYKIEALDETNAFVPIGIPLANTEVYVVDKLKIQAIGEPGELYIGGAGVAIGYLNRPELNEKCFIANPFSSNKNEKIYKTGDLVKCDAEGNLHYLGRIDTQIKIRGHRIEAGAIENVLMDYMGVKECVVLDKTPDHKHELVAYLILNDQNVSLKNLRDYLKTQFPTHMIPSKYVIVEQFPVTANGKIDRKKIPYIKDFIYLKNQKETAPLQNKYEEILIDLIQSFLQMDAVDPESNFFDLGLHSMLCVNMTQALNRILNISLSVVDIFDHPSVRSFAKYLIEKHHIDTDISLDIAQARTAHVEPKLSLESDVAVIGMACKVPGADNYKNFWSLILNKQETIKVFSKEELLQSGVPEELAAHPDYVPRRGVLSDIEKFDAKFFGFTPSEAQVLDPQHRQFLEQAWSALEDAGYDASKVTGKIGVYAGMNDSTYLGNHLLHNPKIQSEYSLQQLLLATSTHYLSTKVAYAFGLNGPSITVNTACSTGLVSIAMACDSLVSQHCDMALAGAVTIISPQETGYLYEELGILSPDGHCRVFDNNAKGTVLSNGCGVVVLKRLTDALKDNDNILAVVKGWAVNNDGAKKVGFTAPSVNGQIECITEALARAKINPIEVEYIEAHGTGTVIGDPIEIAALSKAYAYEANQKSQYCAIGSVKANIGHTDSASGAIGFIKSVLMLHYKTLPPQINFQTANSNINFENSPFFINCEASSWKTKQKTRTAAVHSLGFGGTNAHVIMQEAPVMKTTVSKQANLLVISAKTKASLIANTKQLGEHILSLMQKENAETHLADVAYTLQVGRKRFQWRTAIPYIGYEHILKVLNNPDQLAKHTIGNVDRKSGRIIFGFVGQGAQYADMAVDIYRQHPFFKQMIDECAQQLKQYIECDIRDVIFSKKSNKDVLNIKLRQTQYTQPALFVIEYALAQLLIFLGVKPTNMIGHSIGEYVAATVSGVLNLNDALKLVAARGLLMAETQPGVMQVVPLPRDKVEKYLKGNLDLAAHNAPNLCVVAGSSEEINEFEFEIQPLLEADGLSCQLLHTSHAFHSKFMEPVLKRFRKISTQQTRQEPRIPYISNLTGTWIKVEDLQEDSYWTQHLRKTVLFSEGIQALDLTAGDVFIEIGPGGVLSQLIKQHDIPNDVLLLQTLPAYSGSEQSSYEYLLSTLGKLWVNNVDIVWEHLYTNEIRQRCSLPTYAFDRQSYWVDPIGDKKNIQILQHRSCVDILYKPIWERDKKLLFSPLKNGNATKKSWLLFCNNSSCYELLTASLPRDEIIYNISVGDSYQEITPHSFVINPKNKDDYFQLFRKIELLSPHCGVIHSWLHQDREEDVSEGDILFRGAYHLLYLSQAFSEIHPNKYMQILVITNQVYSVLGNENIIPSKATVLGPCKVIPQEQDNIIFKLIDMDFSVNWTPVLAGILCEEALTITQENFKDEIAYRGNYRWHRKLEPCVKEMQKHGQTRLKNNGVYLITGGLGGIGLVLADYLAEHYSAHIILLTRSALPPKSKWQEYLNDETNSQQKEYKQIKKLMKIEQKSKSLIIEKTLISNEESLSKIIQSIKRKLGGINGVIHAAGVSGGGVAQLKTIETYEKVLLPKLNGTHSLMTCLKDERLDFVVMMSSVTSITGFPGQIDYCSANCVLDAYANLNHYFTHPVFFVTMNWQAWREVGMAAESKTLLMTLDAQNSMSAEEGCVIFEKILSSDLNQVIISKQDLEDYKIPTLTSQEVGIAPVSDSTVIETLKHLWQKILGIQNIGVDDDFYELGGHSLMAVNLLSKIRHHFDIKIPSTILFQVKTIRGLATIIESYKQENEIYSSLINLQQGSVSKSPLFFIHPVGGTVFCYLPLVKNLVTDRMIYAFQDPSIEAEKPLFTCIEDMATFYLEHIRRIQRTGPYYLCGASFGALIVTEIVSRLETEHETVQFVGLIDGWGAPSKIDFDVNYVRDIIQLHHNDKNEEIGLEKRKLWEDLLQQRLNIMKKYQYKKIQHPLILFKAIELLPEYREINAPDNHWSQFTPFPVTIRNIPGDHNTMLQEPSVGILAQAISEYIK